MESYDEIVQKLKDICTIKVDGKLVFQQNHICTNSKTENKQSIDTTNLINMEVS